MIRVMNPLEGGALTKIVPSPIHSIYFQSKGEENEEQVN